MLVLLLAYPKRDQMYQAFCLFDNNQNPYFPNYRHTASKLAVIEAAMEAVIEAAVVDFGKIQHICILIQSEIASLRLLLQFKNLIIKK